MNNYFEKIKKFVDQQILLNHQKNIYYTNLQLSFKLISSADWRSFINHSKDENQDALINCVTAAVIKSFCKANQFYSFDNNAKNELRSIYFQLLGHLKSMAQIDSGNLTHVQHQHLQKLKNWLRISNPFSVLFYSAKDEMITSIISSEYSSSTQINMLKINISELKQPVLDIGCGQSAKLVSFLRNHSIEAYGIDRFPVNLSECIAKDWMDFNFKSNSWGTIISNMGFSNHFSFHHSHDTGKHEIYGRKFMEILYSLKIDGSFFYAPGLLFIEKFLNNKYFECTQYKTPFKGITTSVITRKL